MPPSPTPPSPPPPTPISLITLGLTQNSTTTVQRGLDLYANSRRGLNPQVLDRVLSLAVKSAKPDIVRFLCDTTDVEVGRLGTGRVGEGLERKGGVGEEGVGSGKEGVGSVIEVLKVLVERGWDVNGGGEGGSENLPLIYRVYKSEEILRWCLDHGARIDYPDTEPPGIPPLLEYVGKGGSISTFRFLLGKGAKLGRRTLHRAVEGASCGESERMEMVRFLVEEVGCDVNGMDMPEDKRYPAYYGTPLNYAARCPGAVEVVKYLLEKGANPEIKDCWGFDAFSYARSGGDESVLEVLRQWKDQRDKVEA